MARFRTPAQVLRAVVVVVVLAVGATFAVTGCRNGGKPGGPGETTGTPAFRPTPRSDEGAEVREQSVLMQPADGRSPTLAVMVIHGGSWTGSTPPLIAHFANFASLLPARGWVALVAAYRPASAGLDDLLIQYDDLHRQFPDTPICLVGQSAGGHLALMIATRRSSVRCVINEVGPTDLPALRSGPTPSEVGYDTAVRAFGEDNLVKWSPARMADRIQAHVFQVVAENDPLVPPSQGERLVARLRNGTLRVLRPGSTVFGHSSVDPVQLQEVKDEEVEFLARFAKKPS